MALTTVPRYDPNGVSEVGGQAVVIGASIAGLCTARVLADAFEKVTVIDRDPLPAEPVARRGVPQAHHFHALLEAARATLEDLFPGFGKDMLKAGALLHDGSREVKFYMEGDFLADGPRRRPAYTATRPLYEHVVRQHVRALESVHLRPNCQVTKYLFNDGGTSVTGVRMQPKDGEIEELLADLVVDATGRTSRTPNWLEEHEYTPPPVDEVTIDVAYSTTFIERPEEDRRGVAVIPTPERPRGGVFAPVENNRWLITLWGMHGDDPPTDPEGFEEFAASLPVPHLKQLLDEHPWKSDEISHYPFPSNLRRRYETLDRFPEGLLVLGDAIASFNPIYGQGMSVAALEALELHHSLAADGREELTERYFDRIADTVDMAWNLAVGSDHQFPQTEGPKPRGSDILNWYLSRFLRKAQTDATLSDAFLRVQMMEKPPTSLLHPAMMWRVFKPTG